MWHVARRRPRFAAACSSFSTKQGLPFPPTTMASAELCAQGCAYQTEYVWVKPYVAMPAVPEAAGGLLQGEFYCGQAAFLTPHCLGHGSEALHWHAGIAGKMYAAPASPAQSYAAAKRGLLTARAAHAATFAVGRYGGDGGGAGGAKGGLPELASGIAQLEARVAQLEAKRRGGARLTAMKEGQEGAAAALARLSSAKGGGIRAILFDMDGVMADVSQSYRAAIIQTAAQFGVQLTGADISAAKAEGNANNDWVLSEWGAPARA
jgi:hypothetical protein